MTSLLQVAKVGSTDLVDERAIAHPIYTTYVSLQARHHRVNLISRETGPEGQTSTHS